MTITLAGRDAPAWLAAARLVNDVYGRSYGASVVPNPDHFLVSRDSEGGALACAGLSTPAADGRFFSENYLDEPAETAVGVRLGRRVERNKLVEVGALVSCAPRAGAELVDLVPVVVWFLGFEIILCTVTLTLEAHLASAGINFTPLRPAAVDRLPQSDRQRWGSYYDCEPRVGFIRLDAVERLFSSLTGRYSLVDICRDGAEGRAA